MSKRRPVLALAGLACCTALVAQTPGTVFRGHGDPVYSVAVSANGRTVATGSFDKTVKLWDAATGKELRTLSGHQSLVLAVAFAPNGEAVASGGADNTARVWDVPSTTPTRDVALGAALRKVVASADGKLVAVGSADGTIRVYAADGKPVHELKGHAGAVTQLAFAANGTTLVSGGADRTLRFWNLANGQPTATLGTGAAGIEGLLLTGSGAVTSSADGTLRLWAPQPVAAKKLPDAPLAVSAAGADGGTAVGAKDGTVTLTGADGKPRGTVLAHAGAVVAVAVGTQLLTADADGVRLWTLPLVPARTFPLAEATGAIAHPDGKRLIAAAGKSIRVVKDGATEKALVKHDAAVTALAANGDLLASGDAGGAVHVWSLAKGTVAGSLPVQPKPVTHVWLASDGIVVADGTGRISMWKLPAEAKAKPLFEPMQLKGVRALLAGPTAATFAAVDGAGTLLAYERATGKVVPHPLAKLVAGVDALATSPSGQRILVAKAKALAVYDAATGRELQRFAPAAAFGFLGEKTIFTADGKTATVSEIGVAQAFPGPPGGIANATLLPNAQTIIVGADKSVKAWDAAGKEVRTFGTVAGRAMATSRDGTLVAVANGKGVKLWQTADGKELPFPALAAEPTAFAFSADKTRLAIGSAAAGVNVHDVATGEVVQFFPTAVGTVAVAAHATLPAFTITGADGSNILHAINLVRLAKNPNPAPGVLLALPNSNSMLTAAANGFAVWNVGNGTRERTLEVNGSLGAVAKNGQSYAVAGKETGIDVVNPEGKIIGTVRTSAKPLELAWHPAGLMLAARLSDQTIAVWNVANPPNQPLPLEFGNVVQSLAAPGTNGFAFAGDGSQIVAACEDGHLRTWKLASDQPTRNFAHPNLVDAVAYDPTGLLLATGGHDGFVRIFDVAKSASVKAIAAHTMPTVAPVYAIAWTPDGKQILSASYDKSIKLWDAATGNLVKEMKPGTDAAPGHRDQVFCLDVSPDGKFVASGSSDKTVKLWNLATGAFVREFANPAFKGASHPGFVHGVRFSADGKQLVSVGTAPKNQGYLAAWTVADGKLLSGGERADGAFYAATRTPDGKLLLACGPKVRGQTESEAILVPWPGK